MGDGGPRRGRPGAGWSAVDLGGRGKDRSQNGDGSTARWLGGDVSDTLAFVGHRHHDSDGPFFFTLRTYSAHHRVSTIEFFSWIVLIALSATVLFLLPDGRPLAFAMLKPGSIWLSTWPVAAGAGLTAWVWWQNRRTGRSIPWRPPAGDLLVPVEWLWGTMGHLASKLMGKAAGVFQAHFKKETEKRANGIPNRIEIWEAVFSRWNISSLVFSGIVCALLYVLSRP